ncbi:MAG: MBL fold metallo-hydrolase [Pyrinomonadaceae bacterium]
MSQQVYLKQNVLVEPLFNQWYAWPHLIPPASAAMYIANLHLGIMRSYVRAPQVHAAAVKNPAMLGGPFIDYQGKKVNEVKALLDQTTGEQSHMLEFAEAVKTLDVLLKTEAKGFSIESLYEKTPSILRGYVELVYDLNNQPSIRFIEGLLYKSSFYNTSSQSISLSLIEQDYRPFVLSTPRLQDDAHLQINIPFDHAGIDELCKMRDVAQSFDHIKEALGVSAGDADKFRTFFTPERHDGAGRRAAYTGDDLRVRYFGHASVLFETKGVSIFTDPSVSYEYDSEISRYTFMDLPEVIDYVLLTHAHQDHILLETLLQLRHKIRNVVIPRSMGGTLYDPSLKMILKRIGFKSVIELDELEELEIEGGTITALPFLGEHGDLSIRTKTAFQIRLGERSIVCAADSNNLEPLLYNHIHDAIGDVDVMFLGMECDGAPFSWVYGPLLTQAMERKLDQSRRLNGSDFIRAHDLVKRFNCGQVYIYAMGQEPWLNHIMCLRYTDQSPQIVESNKLLDECRKTGTVTERLFGKKEMLLKLA